MHRLFFVFSFFVALSFFLVGNVHATPFMSQEEYDALLDAEEGSVLIDDESNVQESGETIPEASVNQIVTDTSNQQDVVGCFDYYTFGSVRVDLSSQTNQVVSGSSIHFNGTIHNENPYPIVDGALYVKLYRTQSNENLAHQNGHNIVDQFFVIEDLDLLAQGSAPLTFSWNIPAYAQTGEYRIATFFTSAKKYNLLGLSFTDDVTGGTYDFDVVGEHTNGISFNKNTVTVNGARHQFNAFPTRNNKDADITVAAELLNQTRISETVEVTWKLYGWDGQSEDNLLDTKKETIQVLPNETKKLNYVDTSRTHSTHYLVAEVKHKDTKSILNIRYVREGVDRARLNFPSIIKYPLVEGEENTVFACMHNAGLGVITDSVLTLTLKDSHGDEIHTYTYTGQIPSAMIATKSDFTPKRTYTDFSLIATLMQDGRIVDETTIHYDCANLSPDNCPVTEVPTPLSENTGTLIFKMVFVVVLLLGIGVLGVFYFIKTRKIADVSTPTILLVLMLSSFSLASTAEAKNLQWEQTTITDIAKHRVLDGALDWQLALSNPHYIVHYSADAFNNTTQAVLNDGDIVHIGDAITFTAHLDEISWNGTGSYADTPLGNWVPNALPLVPATPGTASQPPSVCRQDDWLGRFYSNVGSFMDMYIPFSVHPPTVTFTNAGSAALNCTNAGNTSSCIVNSEGTIDMQIAFEETYGRHFFRYRHGQVEGGPTTECRGRDIPMRTCTALHLETTESSGAQVGGGAQQVGGFVTCSVQSTDYTVNVPRMTTNFNFTTAAYNQPPSTPIITGPVESLVETLNSFAMVSTDPENDQLKYCIDWYALDGVDACHEYAPATGFVNSGTSLTTQKIWTLLGGHTFKVKAIDAQGSQSGWATHTIDIVNPVCTGDEPVHAHTCSSLEPTANTPYGLVNSCAYMNLNKCIYACDSGFVVQGNSCVQTECNNGIDDSDPEDTTFDLSDPGCTSEDDTSELNLLPTLSASPRIVEFGDSTRLSWNLNENMGCTLTGGNKVFDVESATSSTTPIFARTLFTLQCPTGNVGTTVELVPSAFES